MDSAVSVASGRDADCMNRRVRDASQEVHDSLAPTVPAELAVKECGVPSAKDGKELGKESDGRSATAGGSSLQ